jgi:hypothetical protein
MMKQIFLLTACGLISQTSVSRRVTEKDLSDIDKPVMNSFSITRDIPKDLNLMK